MTRSALLLALVVLVEWTPGVAFAARLGRSEPLGLTNQDLAMMHGVEQTEMDGKPEGTKIGWRNAQSGNSGTVTLIRRDSLDGRECRQVRHLISASKTNQQRDYTMKTCLQADGSWKYY